MIKSKIQNKGSILILVMVFVLLMSATVLAFTSVLRGDIELVKRATLNEQAKNIAESGINHARAKLEAGGFDSQTDFATTMDTGSYVVTFSQVGTRYLVTSVGTSGGVSRTVVVEIRKNAASALDYLIGVGNTIRLRCFPFATISLNGDIHANDMVYLSGGPVLGRMDITGEVSATGEVKEGTIHYLQDKFDENVYINGQSNDSATVEEGAPRIDFPVFDYELHKAAAIDSGDYYSGNKTFTDTTLSPANGIVYVEGIATFKGVCTVSGGIVAEKIRINGTLIQKKYGDYNMVVARGGNISVFGRIDTEEALIYAQQDFVAVQWGAIVDINGILLAGRKINIDNVFANIDYNYVRTIPTGTGTGDSGTEVEIVSWNR